MNNGNIEVKITFSTILHRIWFLPLTAPDTRQTIQISYFKFPKKNHSSYLPEGYSKIQRIDKGRVDPGPRRSSTQAFSLRKPTSFLEIPFTNSQIHPQTRYVSEKRNYGQKQKEEKNSFIHLFKATLLSLSPEKNLSKSINPIATVFVSRPNFFSRFRTFLIYWVLLTTSAPSPPFIFHLPPPPSLIYYLLFIFFIVT